MAIHPLPSDRCDGDLRARTEYEAWLLEAVYDITDQRIAVRT